MHYLSTQVYDSVGAGYNTTRAADPYITDRILEYLRPQLGERYLDIGCGTGNYLTMITQRDVNIWGVDVSTKMLDVARAQHPQATLVLAAAEQIPLRNLEFGGAIAILTTHHWKDLGAAFAEIRRVLKPGASFVMFTFTPEQVQSYWLRKYFPQMIHDSAALVPSLPVMKRTLQASGFTNIILEPYHVRDDLRDHFLYSNKYRPEAYLSTEVRAGASAFSVLIEPKELVDGLASLTCDIESGRIREVVSSAIQAAESTGDYMFIAATAGIG